MGVDANRLEAPGGTGGRQSYFAATRRRQPGVGINREICPVGDPAEHAVPAFEAKYASIDKDLEGTAQGKDSHFLAPSGQVDVATGGQSDHPQACICPSSLRRTEGYRVLFGG
jgi:hypothetical protein